MGRHKISKLLGKKRLIEHDDKEKEKEEDEQEEEEEEQEKEKNLFPSDNEENESEESESSESEDSKPVKKLFLKMKQVSPKAYSKIYLYLQK